MVDEEELTWFEDHTSSELRIGDMHLRILDPDSHSDGLYVGSIDLDAWGSGRYQLAATLTESKEVLLRIARRCVESDICQSQRGLAEIDAELALFALPPPVMGAQEPASWTSINATSVRLITGKCKVEIAKDPFTGEFTATILLWTSIFRDLRLKSTTIEEAKRAALLQAIEMALDLQVDLQSTAAALLTVALRDDEEVGSQAHD